MGEKKPAIRRYRRPRRSLTVEDVAQINAHLSQGERPATLARYFHVTHTTIGLIRDGKIWVAVKPADEAVPLSSRMMRRI
jgi:hypothetical protein